MEAWKILTMPVVTSFIEEHLEEDPASLALRFPSSEFPISLASTQIKYLQKARTKLPSFYAHRCLLPAKAYEQCSSEAAASLKTYAGARALDLTCGLGVDVLNWASHFDTVVALEPDTTLHPFVSHNLERMDIQNVRVLCLQAEAFLADYQGPPFDLIYADPDRRDGDNRRLYSLEDASPNLLTLWPKLSTIGTRILVKLSPMLDVKEAARLLPHPSSIIVLSVDGECKEVLVEIIPSQATPTPTRQLWMLRHGKATKLTLPEFPPSPSSAAEINPLSVRYLAEPDVAAYKADAVVDFWAAGPWQKDWLCPSPRGFWMTAGDPTEVFPGRILRVETAMRYKPKLLKKWFSQQGIRRLEISRRDFPLNVAEVRKTLSLAEGGQRQMWCTRMEGEKWVFIGEPVEQGRAE